MSLKVAGLGVSALHDVLGAFAMAEPTLLSSVRKGLRFEDPDGNSLLVAAAERDALPQPKMIRLGRVPGPARADADPRIWQLWGIQKAFGPAEGFALLPEEIQRFTTAPNQIVFVSTVFEVEGHEVSTLGGHYALDDAGRAIEFGFDRSFVRGIGLHRLSIIYRLYASALTLVIDGRGREFTPTFSRILASNTASRRSYARAGGCEFDRVPECLGTSAGGPSRPRPVAIGGPDTHRSLRYIVFPPSAVLAGFDAMLATVEAGRWETSKGSVELDLDLGDVGTPAVARSLRSEVEVMCRLQTRHLARYECYRQAVRQPTA